MKQIYSFLLKIILKKVHFHAFSFIETTYESIKNQLALFDIQTKGDSSQTANLHTKPYFNHGSKIVKSLAAQLTLLGVSNRDIQGSNPPSPSCNYQIIKNYRNKIYLLKILQKSICYEQII